MLVRVKGSVIKQAFGDAAPLLRKSETSKSIAIGYSDHKIYFTVDTGVKYQYVGDVIDVVDAVDITVSVWFRDISGFVYARDDVTLEITSTAVSISAPGFETTLSASDAVLTRYTPSKGRQVSIDMMLLGESIRKLSSCTALTKSLKTTRPIIFNEDYAYIKFSTVWIRSASSTLNTVLSIDHAKNILDFYPKYVVLGDVLEFHRDNAVLVVPNARTESEQEFNDVYKTLKSVTTLNLGNIGKTLHDLSRVTGTVSCTAKIRSNGLEIVLQHPENYMARSYGDTGEVLTSFEMPLEFLVLCFELLGETYIEVKRLGGIVCLENSERTILISVL